MTHSKDNFSVLNFLVKVYHQEKASVYTSAISASLFGISKLLEGSKRLETISSALESSASAPQNGETVLRDLALLLRETGTSTLLQSVTVLHNFSHQMEEITKKICEFEVGKTSKSIQFVEKNRPVLEKKVNLMLQQSLKKLLQLSRAIEVLTDELEVLSHRMIDSSFDNKRTLHTLDKINQLNTVFDAHFSQAKLKIWLHGVNKLLCLSKQLETKTISLEENTRKMCGSSIRELSDIYKISSLRQALLLTAHNTISSLFNFSKCLEHVTHDLELSAHVIYDPAFKPEENSYLIDVIFKTTDYMLDKSNSTCLALFNYTLVSALELTNNLLFVTKQLEKAAISLESKTAYHPFIAQDYKSASLKHFYKEYERLISAVKYKIKSSEPYISSIRAFFLNTLNTSALIATVLLFCSSKMLEKATAEFELVARDLYKPDLEAKQRSHVLKALKQVQRKISWGKQEINGFVRRASIYTTLSAVTKAHAASKHLESIVATSEAYTLKMCEPGSERKIFNDALLYLSSFVKNGKDMCYRKTFPCRLSVVLTLHKIVKHLEAPTTQLEAILQRKTPKCVKRTKQTTRRDISYVNDDDSVALGKSYKMMSASKELERLLNELEAFVNESADVRQKQRSQLSEIKQHTLSTAKKVSELTLRKTIAGLLLVNVSVLLGASKFAEGFTSSVEARARKFSEVDLKSVLYNISLSVILFNLRHIVNTSKQFESVTSELELLTHEVCYPLAHRREISQTLKLLKRTMTYTASLRHNIRRKRDQVVFLLSQEAACRFAPVLKNMKEMTITLESVCQPSFRKQLFRRIHENSIKISLGSLLVLLTLSKYIETGIVSFETRLCQPKIALPEEESNVSIYASGINVLLGCVAQLRKISKFLELFTSELERTTECEPLNVSLWNVLNKLNVTFTKNVECRCNISSILFAIEFDFKSSFNCNVSCNNLEKYTHS